MKRSAELYAKRRALMARCDAQRSELAWRIAQLSPRRWAQLAAASVAPGGRVRPGRRPLAWLFTVVGLVLLRNPRYALSLLGRTRTAATWLTRAAEVLSLLAALRKSTRRERRVQDTVT